MKSKLFSVFWKTTPLVVLLALIIGHPAIAHAGELEHSAGLSQGYLMVYSATDEFNDGGAPYYAHSSYSIYTMDGKLFKRVENHISRSDEIPQIVALPVGYYMVEARSENEGCVRRRVVMKAGQQTTLDLDRREKGSLKRIAQS
jgi:hypothetical protein